MMMMNPIMMLVMLAAGGQQNELLSFLSTDAYWQERTVTVTADNMMNQLSPPKAPDISSLAKDLGSDLAAKRDAAQKKIIAMGPAVIDQVKPLLNSADTEVAERARQIVAELDKGAVTAASRLMAIRALGELKCKPALPVLQKLLDSKEAFVSQYARDAIARINGQAVAPSRPDAKALRDDLCLLPKNCGIVGQLSMAPGGGAFSMEKTLTDMTDMLMGGGADKVKMIDQCNKALAGFADKAGNVRLDGVTIGFSDNLGTDEKTHKESGYAVVIGRGLYDPRQVGKMLQEEGELKLTKVDGVDTLAPQQVNRGMTLILASPERLILLGGPSQADLPVKEMVAALKSGKGGLGDNAEMTALVKSVDTTAHLWVAVRMSDAYRKEKFFAPLDSITFVGRQKEGTMRLELVAVGKDAALMKESLDTFNNGLKDARDGFDESAKAMPAMPAALSSMGDFLKSIKVDAAGTKVTVTAELKSASPASLLTLPMFMRTSARKPPPAGVAPARPLPPASQPK